MKLADNRLLERTIIIIKQQTLFLTKKNHNKIKLASDKTYAKQFNKKRYSIKQENI